MRNKCHCDNCNEILCTEDFWCFSTVDSNNLIIGSLCPKCDSAKAFAVRWSDFKTVNRYHFNFANGDQKILEQLNELTNSSKE